MANSWQRILILSGGGSISFIFLIALILSLTGMQYSFDGDKQCTDCYSLIQVNSSYWNVCVEHAQDKDLVFKKSPFSQVLWVNLDKINSSQGLVSTVPSVPVEILVPTIKSYATVKSDEYGYLRPLKDGDCLIKRKTKSNPNPSKIIIHAVEPVFRSVKWSFVLSDYLMQDISIDPWWNSSYVYYANITSEPTLLTSVGAVNGTNAFLGKTVWVNAVQCGGDLGIYYNSSSLYAVACNDSSLASFETEEGGLNNSPSSLYDVNTTGLWHFGVNETTISDSTSYGSNLSAQGVTWKNSGCVYGNCFEFDGVDDYINHSTDPDTYSYVTGEFSGCTWFNLKSTNVGQILFSKQRPTTTYRGWGFQVSNTSTAHGISWLGILNYTAPQLWINVYSQQSSISAGTWYHACFTYDGSLTAAGVELYFNGVKQSKIVVGDNLTSTFGVPTAQFAIGARALDDGTIGNVLNGSLDDVRIYNKILTEAEVSELYNNSQNLTLMLEVESGAMFNQSIPDSTVSVNKLFTLQVNCTGPGTVVYTDNTSLFTIDSSTGLINFTPAIIDAGIHNIRITCTVVGSATDDFVLNITTINATFCSFQTDGTKYEYEHTMQVNNITTDGTVCLSYEWDTNYTCLNNVTGTNLTYDMNLTKYWLFNDSSSTNTINSTQTAYFIVDNRTDIINGSVNISGIIDTTYPKNFSLALNNNIFAIFMGTLESNYVRNPYMLYSGSYVEAQNLSWASAGSKTYYINFSTNNVDYKYNHSDNFTYSVTLTGRLSNNNITSTFIDAYNVSTSGYIVDNATSFGSVDSFTNNKTMNTSWGSTCAHEGGSYTCTWNVASGYLSVGTSISGCGFGCTSTITETVTDSNGIEDYNLANNQNVSLNFYESYSSYNGLGYVNFYLYDNTSTAINIYTHSYGGTGSSTIDNQNLTFYKSGNNIITKLNGATHKTTAHTSLNNGRWYIGFVVNSNTLSYSGEGASMVLRVYWINSSTARLTESSMNFVTSPALGEIRSRTTTEHAANVSSAFVSWESITPEGTSIKYYASANNGTNWEEVTTSGDEVVFTVPGNMTVTKMVLNSTNNNVTPINKLITLSVIGRYPEDVSIDFGSDNDDDATISGNLSGVYVFNYSSSDDWNTIDSLAGNDLTYLMPIKISSDSAGQLELSVSNLSYNVNPVDIYNVTGFLEDFNGTANFTWSGGTGNLSFSDLNIEYYGNYLDFSVVCAGYSADSTVSTEQNVSIYFSNFNVSLPSGIEEWAVYPVTANDKGLKPFGQDRGFTSAKNGIYNISSLAYDTNIHVYRYYNESLPPCMTIETTNSSQGYPRINLTTSTQRVLVNITEGESKELWDYVNLTSCSGWLNYTYSWFDSLCDGCVETW